MNAFNRRLAQILVYCLLLLVVIPIIYLKFLDAIILHPGLRFSCGWEDHTFDIDDWQLAYNIPVNASISSESGMLKVSTTGNITAGTIVAAQRLRDLSVNLTDWNYLKVSIMTSSINVAARIVIWVNASYSRDVLVKTYNDNEWHTEMLDLSFFGLVGDVHMIELSFMELYPSNRSEWTLYKQLSFDSLEV